MSILTILDSFHGRGQVLNNLSGILFALSINKISVTLILFVRTFVESLYTADNKLIGCYFSRSLIYLFCELVYCGEGCKNTITVFPVCCKKQLKEMERGVWKAPPLVFSPLKRQATVGGEESNISPICLVLATSF